MRWLIVLALVGCQSSNVSRRMGARCDQSSECDQRCLGPDNIFPGGFCTIACDHSSDCPDSGSCIDDQGGECLFHCLDDTDCTFLGDGWRCLARDERNGGGVKVTVCIGG